MKLIFLNREQIGSLGSFLVEEFDSLIGRIRTGWNVEHTPEGAHKNVTADSITADVMRVPEGTADAAALQLGGRVNTGWSSIGDSIYLYVQGVLRYAFSGNAPPAFTVANGAHGGGAVPGSSVSVGRNSSGSFAAGYLELQRADGAYYCLWVDATGDLRISTTPPTANGSVSDTSGTVVGTQT